MTGSGSRCALSLAGLLALLGACTQARIGDTEGVGGSVGPDAGAAEEGVPDAAGLEVPDAEPAPDAGPTQSTLTHSADTTIKDDHSVACVDLETGFHASNSYYRVFDLQQDFGIAADFEVSSVTVGVQEAAASAGSQPMQVVLHTLEGELALENLNELATTQVTVEDQNLNLLEVPLTAAVPAGSVLVAELVLPDGRADQNLLFVGMNDAGQTAPTYLRAADCGIDQPTDLANIQDGNGNTFPDRHLVLEVTGSSLQTAGYSR